jgi:DNA-binding Lrp family transcriptional regulator
LPARPPIVRSGDGGVVVTGPPRIDGARESRRVGAVRADHRDRTVPVGVHRRSISEQTVRLMSDSVTAPHVEGAELSDLDFALYDALQDDPRAPWAGVAAAIGVSAPTARRRWQRLEASGTAWIVTYQGRGSDGVMASVEVRTAPGEVDAVAAALCAFGQVMTVAGLTGDRDLLLIVMGRSLAEFRHVVSEQVGRTPGVVRVRSALMTRNFRDGSHWRATSDRGSRRPDARRAVPDVGPAPTLAQEIAVLGALQRSGRLPIAELAGELDVSEPVARRVLRRLVADDRIRQRIDVDVDALGWPHALALWLQAPSDRLHDAAARISSLPTTRLCVSLAGGPGNILVISWMRAIADATDVEAMVGAVSKATVVDRSILLHYYKRLGHVFADSGAHVGSVPSYPA